MLASCNKRKYAYLTLHDRIIIFKFVTASVPFTHLLFQTVHNCALKCVDLLLITKEHERRICCDVMGSGCFLHTRQELVRDIPQELQEEETSDCSLLHLFNLTRSFFFCFNGLSHVSNRSSKQNSRDHWSWIFLQVRCPS